MAVSVASGGRRGKRGRRGRAPMAEINVTPLVDVMLVLLIIFMVTAPMLTAGVPIDLPDSRAKALSEERLKVDLAIASDGTVYVDDQPVAMSALPGMLASLPRQADGKPPLVTLRGDRTLDYGKVMAVMGELNRAGFDSITLVTNASVAIPGGAKAGVAADDVSGGSGERN